MSTPRTAQFARYTAIVAASAASLTLTVTAGVYVMSQMVPGTSTFGPGTVRVLPAPPVADVPSGIAPTFAAAGSGAAGPAFVVASAYFGGSTHPPVTEPVAAAGPADPPGVPLPPAETAPRTEHAPSAERLDLGVAAVDASRDGQRTTVTVTVDAGLSSALYRMLTGDPAAFPPGGATRLSTEIDGDRGELALGLSDPVLGDRTVAMPTGTIAS